VYAFDLLNFADNATHVAGRGRLFNAVVCTITFQFLMCCMGQLDR
jgi:hypothetical protein